MPNIKKILIVDDDADLREIFQIQLETAGYLADGVGSIKEAFSEIEKGSFDLILSDIFMPEGNGLKLVKFAKEKNIPVIAITGHLNAYESFIPDDVPVLKKPFEEEDLLKKVEELLKTTS